MNRFLRKHAIVSCFYSLFSLSFSVSVRVFDSAARRYQSFARANTTATTFARLFRKNRRALVAFGELPWPSAAFGGLRRLSPRSKAHPNHDQSCFSRKSGEGARRKYFLLGARPTHVIPLFELPTLLRPCCCCCC